VHQPNGPPVQPYRPTVIRDGVVVRAVTTRAPVGFAQPEDRVRWRFGAGSPLLGLIVFVVLCLAVVVAGIFIVRHVQRVGITVNGLAEGDVRSAGALAAGVVSADVDGGDIAEATVLLDGEQRADVLISGDRVSWVADGIEDGPHELEVVVPRTLFGSARTSVSFTVDSQPPVLDVPSQFPPVAIDQPVRLDGWLEPGSTLTVDGEPHPVAPNGTFQLDFDLPPTARIELRAVDVAGNVTEVSSVVPVEYPEVRAVHVSAAAWAHDELKAGILDLIETGRINAVELDLKDEDGEIGFDSTSRIGAAAGAVANRYDLAAAVEELHDLGVRVIGRIVAFRDPLLVRYAWENDLQDWVIQTPSGQPHGKYGGFTNYAHADVLQYNLDIALEAADAGIDDILWDYIRRPEGPPDSMIIPLLGGKSSSQHIVDFLDDSHAKLRERGVVQGVSVFGIAVTRPDQIAQDVPAMAAASDYVAPMVYPSLWTNGEYGVEDPEAQPYDIVKKSLADFVEAVDGTGATLVPWIQDFSLGMTYGEQEVRDQLEAAAELGTSGWVVWDPRVTYTVAALDPRPAS
jgi:hypothetical protein